MGEAVNEIGTVRAVASSSLDVLRSIDGMGPKKSLACLDAARAIDGGRPVRRSGQIDLPERSIEVFFDLEWVSDVFEGTIDDYLIGALVRRGDMETYHPFVAERKREDAMLGSFLEFMSGLDDYAERRRY